MELRRCKSWFTEKMQDIFSSSHAAMGHSDFTVGGGVASSYAMDGVRGREDIESSTPRKQEAKDREERVEETRKKRVESIESSGSELVREWEEKQSMFATASFLCWSP